MEAMIGLLIEVSFIATFTLRFFENRYKEYILLFKYDRKICILALFML
jgi:hypothetical protein